MALLEGLLMAVSFLTMWQESWLPKPIPPGKWAWDPRRPWTHNMKDRMCARIRADVEWWTKFHWFSILFLAIMAIAVATTVCVQLIVH